MAFRWPRVLVCTAAGVAIAVTLALLVSALWNPRPKVGKSEWERYRRREIAKVLSVIHGTAELLREVRELQSEGYSLNQAVGAVTKKMAGLDLSRDRWGGAPLLLKDEEGRAVLVDMWGRPYQIAEADGALVLRRDTRGEFRGHP